MLETTTPPSFDVCMFVHNPVSIDVRVLKEAKSLAAAGWQVAIVGVVLDGSSLPEIEQVNGFTIWRVIPRLLVKQLSGSWGKLLRLIVALPSIWRKLRQANARVYHGNDFTGLVITALTGLQRPIIYDSRELFFDRWPHGVHYPLKHLLRLLRPLERILAQRTAACITVNDSIADILAKKLKIPRPVVIRNSVDLRDQAPAAAEFPRAGRRLVAHSGNLMNGRHLSELVASLQYLPGDIALVLLGNGTLRESLLEQAQMAGTAERLIIVPPVPYRSIAATMAQADVGVVLTSPHITNNYYALPNKFFEAIAAGLPLVISPIPEVQNLATRYDLGAICDPTDPRSIAQAIQTILLPENSTRYRANALKAREVLNWESDERVLVNLYRGLLNGKE